MKDRIERTYQKKPSHLLKRSMIGFVVTTLFSAIACSVLITHYTSLNQNLSRQIEEYEDQIDYLEYQNDEMLLKNNQKNP